MVGVRILQGNSATARAAAAVLRLLWPQQGESMLGVVRGSASPQLQRDTLQLLDAGCMGILVVWSDSSDRRPPWLGGKGASGLSEVSSANLRELIQCFWRLLERVVHGDAAQILRARRRWTRTIRASLVYDAIENYSHGGRFDITNHLLGPARVLAEAQNGDAVRALWKARKALLSEFETKVAGSLSPECGDLGADIRLATETVKGALEQLDLASVAEAAQVLMDLMTESRVLSGMRPKADSTVPELPRLRPSITAAEPRPQPTWRVLVVDDHAESWEPIFEALQYRLPSVQFDLSIDGEDAYRLGDPHPRSPNRRVSATLPDYDLVLLDIYLRGKKNGLQVLDDIRTRLMHLPVVLWTTSTERELPAQAALANGFIFKKTTTIDEIVGVLHGWLTIGRSHRMWSLPNPFFDHTIRDPKLREAALAFTKWTLRYMDCFHALDHHYFRYFNDHGGRHILGVLDAVARLLRPFLIPGTSRVGEELLALDEDQRGRQLFALYVAVLCHEFGMFPIWKSDVPLDGKNNVSLEWQRLDHVRRLHAVRGLMMLESPVHDAPNLLAVAGSADYLSLLDDVGLGVRSAVALLVGHHQRCLSLTVQNGKFAATNGEAAHKLNSAAEFLLGQVKEIPAWANLEKVAHECSIAWKKSAPLWAPAQLRKLCAIFRFADSLDVDHTRVPADFIVNEQAKRRPLQDVEDCKRQVSASVSIDAGSVSIGFFCKPPETSTTQILQEFARAWRASVRGRSSVGRSRAGQERKDLITAIDKQDAQVAEATKAWLQGTRQGNWPKYDEKVEKCLRHSLQAYFEAIRMERSSIGTDVEDAMATAAAVLVLLELRSEYKAIEDVGLTGVIRLADVTWGAGDRQRLPSVMRRAND